MAQRRHDTYYLSFLIDSKYKIVNLTAHNYYSIDTMSSKCRTMFERGQFFIETGSPKSLRIILGSNKIFRYIPEFIVGRIEEYLDKGDKDSAKILWFKACENADLIPQRMWAAVAYTIINLTVIGMAIYSIVCIVR